MADLLRLTKPKIGALTSLTAAAGYLLGSGHLSAGLAFPVAGTLFLAAGSATLNNLQDVRLDERMARTRGRPLPQRRVAPPVALASALALLFAGFGLLGFSEQRGPLAQALGLAALALYNGLYAWLKRRTVYAAAPGALVGALPPLIGWAASGASFASAPIWLVAGFYFLWQVPHFWLFLLLNDSDYARASLPVMTERLPDSSMTRVTVTWMLASALAGAICAASLAFSIYCILPMLAALAVLIVLAVRMLRADPGGHACRAAFTAINLYALMATVLFGFSGLVA